MCLLFTCEVHSFLLFSWDNEVHAHFNTALFVKPGLPITVGYSIVIPFQNLTDLTQPDMGRNCGMHNTSSPPFSDFQDIKGLLYCLFNSIPTGYSGEHG